MKSTAQELLELMAWSCDHCGTLNPPYLMDCRTCAAPKKQHNEPSARNLAEKLSKHALFCQIDMLPSSHYGTSRLWGSAASIRVLLSYGKVFRISHIETPILVTTDAQTYEKRSGPFGMFRETVHIPSKHEWEPPDVVAARGLGRALSLLEKELRRAYVKIPKQYEWIYVRDCDIDNVFQTKDTSEWEAYWSYVEEKLRQDGFGPGENFATQ